MATLQDGFIILVPQSQKRHLVRTNSK